MKKNHKQPNDDWNEDYRTRGSRDQARHKRVEKRITRALHMNNYKALMELEEDDFC